MQQTTLTGTKKAWRLMLWEARLIIQLPVSLLFLYSSALFIHFDFNISDFTCHIFTMPNSETPTKGNSGTTPINGVKDRGPIVFFNQASVFQYAELASTVSRMPPVEQGVPTAVHNESYIKCMPCFNVN